MTDAGDVEAGRGGVAVKAAAEAGKVDRRRIKPPGQETRASDHRQIAEIGRPREVL